MNKYFVELDGVSTIASHSDIAKDDLLLLVDSFESSWYKVTNVNEQKLSLKPVKFTSNAIEETKFEHALGEDTFYFNNRLSMNQLILLNGMPCQVKGIDKETKYLRVDLLKRETAKALYLVYESRLDEGLTIRDREKNGYTAEKYFTQWEDAYGYVAHERLKGRKVSR